MPCPPDQPEYCNSDGDDVMFHDLRFPFASGVTQKELAMRLDRIKGLASEGPKFWNWLAPKRRRLHKAATGIMRDSQMDGRTVLGGLELKGKALQVSVNSTNRAMQIEALVMEAAGDLLKIPLTTIRSIDQMMAEQRRTDPKHGDDEIPPELAMRIAHDYMDKHYRETLDAPLPALGGKSPRQAVGTAAGREKVIEWLKLLENRSARQGENPIGTYDFSWMWTELGLSEDRR